MLPKSETRSTVRLSNGQEFTIDGSPTDFEHRMVPHPWGNKLAILRTYEGKDVVINLDHVVSVSASEYHGNIYPRRRD